MKAMKVTFEQEKETYPEHVAQGVRESLIQADKEQLIRFSEIKDMLDKK